ncbi:TMV resistance protein N-like [Camellia sinensis]|uniref:TMV resistance protein N-like n=1 Tax=Camellia sinensis TaxID=4442 RepID=UPI001035D1CD|nr:TMV resistance protein N-like [Camellia sinensis]
MASKRTSDHSSCFASSSSATQPRWSYDVFLSFRGEDTRKNFTDHLYEALVQAGIHTLRDDDELPRGREISSELLKSIEGSRISIVVFSRNYASSRWCLDELVKIIECKKTIGQLVLPIFYDVDPSHVRHQTGYFGEAFGRHEKRFADEMEKVEVRRAALSEAANLSGWDLQNVDNGHEAKFIRKIVKEVLCELKHTILNVAVHPVGIDSHVKHIKSLLSTRSDDVCMIGIYGLGGIGKTTIAKAVYNHIFLQFEGSCFLANVREVAGQLNGLVQLQEQLLFELLGIENLKIGSIGRGINLMKERLHSKKVLIVLDDVDQLSQLNTLAGHREWFGGGSRIIITTRDEHLLNGPKVDERYMAKELNHEESLQLFSWHAFGKINPSENCADLANDIVRYASGLPLALEVLGSYLFGRNMVEWKSAFDKLQQIPHEKIQEKLRISFDALDDDNIKDIFLDIACFFIGMDRDYVITILNGCGFFAEIGISVLISRCLLRINKKNKLMMHDLLRDMGREIIREKYPKELEKRSRLWFHEDVCYVLEKNKGTEAVEGVILSLPMLKKIQWSNKAFVGMHKLRLLQINHVHLSGNFEHLFEELRWLCWRNCPMEYLPSNFHPEKLVALDMQFSRFKTLRTDGKFKSLKILNLSNSKSLTKSPIFCALSMLEELLLESCTSLMELHESIELLDKLVHLNLKDCMNLRYLPGSICKLKSVKYLNLTGCAKLEEFPEHLGHMESLTELLANGTAIKQLPFSIGLLKNLRMLLLKGCNRQLTTKSWFSLISSWVLPRKNADSIRFLPSSVSGLCSLTKLDLSDRNLSEGDFPADLRSLSSLRVLDLGGNNFCRLPYGFSNLSKLEDLQLNNCTSLQSISDLPPNLLQIRAYGCASLEKISDLSKLKTLKMLLSSSHRLRPGHSLSNYSHDGMEEPHCFEGARIIPLDKLNNLQNPLQHLSSKSYFCDYFFIAGGIDYFSYITRSSSISLEVPVVRGEDDYVLGFNVGVVYYRIGNEESCSMELDDYPYVIITDKSNGIDFTYTPTFFGIPKSCGDYVWGSHIIVEEYFGYRIKGGEQFEISFVMSSRFKTKKCASDLIVVSHNGGRGRGRDTAITFYGLSGYWRLEPSYMTEDDDENCHQNINCNGPSHIFF